MDVAVIGAGPIGLACAIEVKKRKLQSLIFEKGYLLHSIYHFPQNMTFFSTPEQLEIGGVPFIIQSEKPKRTDALKYYWRVARFFELQLQLFTHVRAVHKERNRFLLETDKGNFTSKTVILATGYYDNPNLLEIPGEELPHVSHHYSDPHCFVQKQVVIIGGGNSAVEAALELYRYGVEVMLVHRHEHLDNRIKYWLLPDMQRRIQNGEIPAIFATTVSRITPDAVVLQNENQTITRKADAVLALTGYHPDFDFMKRCGIRVDEDRGMPEFDQETGETNVAGIFLAGALRAGKDANKVFIENGRHHAEQIAEVIQKRLGS